MTERDKLITQFLDAPRDTPQAIVDAVNQRLSAGAWSKIADYIMDYCHERDIQGDELAFIERETARGKAREERERKKQTAQTLIQRTERFQEGLNDERIPLTDQNLMDAEAELGELAAKLRDKGTAQERERIATGQDYLTKCQNYDPEKDFTPSLFAGLRCPNATLSYIGARPGGGKTTAMVNIAREAITDTSRSVFFVNLEMTNKQIITNLILSLMYDRAGEAQRKELAAVTNPLGTYYRLFRPEASAESATFIALRNEAIAEITALLDKRLFVYDGTGNTLEGITLDIKARVSTGDVVLVDYIQRMPAPVGNHDQRYLQIKLASNALLYTAIEQETIVIAAAQFNRDGVKDGKEATLEDFRESGDIEQDAHNAIALEKTSGTERRYIHTLKAREGKGPYERTTLDWIFPYNHMISAGTEHSTGKTETPEKKPAKREKTDAERWNEI